MIDCYRLILCIFVHLFTEGAFINNNSLFIKRRMAEKTTHANQIHGIRPISNGINHGKMRKWTDRLTLNRIFNVVVHD